MKLAENAYFNQMKCGAGYNNGAWCAYRAWKRAIELDVNALCVEDCPTSAEEAAEFAETLRKAGVNSFLVIDQSTRLMRGMHAFNKAGCTFTGFEEIEAVNDFGKAITFEALRFKVR